MRSPSRMFQAEVSIWTAFKFKFYIQTSRNCDACIVSGGIAFSLQVITKSRLFTCSYLLCLCPFVDYIGKIEILRDLNVKFSSLFLVVCESNFGVEHWQCDCMNAMVTTPSGQNTVHSLSRSIMYLRWSPRIQNVSDYKRWIYRREQPHFCGGPLNCCHFRRLRDAPVTSQHTTCTVHEHNHSGSRAEFSKICFPQK